MKTPLSSIIFFLIAGFLGAIGQYLYKSGAEKASGTFISFISNGRILAGVICYIAVMVLFVAAFKRGGELSVLYPLYATTFIWAAVISLWAYHIPIKPVNVFGALCLITGMYFMGK
ncbi:MAG: hypothetical protein KC422_17855 [Trueperaceae bacterium]|nr:hypothetical protein [Trueperaceae bacterium]